MGAADVKPEERRANYVECIDCKHVWPGFYLPMPVTDFCKIAKSLRCPRCAGKNIYIYEPGKVPPTVPA